MEQWDLHGRVPGASSVDLLLQSRWTAWPPCRCNQFNVCCIFCLKPSLIVKYFHQEGEVLAFSVWSSPTNWWDEPQGAAGDFFTFTFFCWPLSVPTNSPQMGGRRWPMEPKPAVWKPHRSLLQRQGELEHVVKQSFKKRDLMISLL